MTLQNESFRLFSSLRYDPLLVSSQHNCSPSLSFREKSPFYMLKYHRDRMLEASERFGFHNVVPKLTNGTVLEEQLIERVNAHQSGHNITDGPLKVRILFNQDGIMDTEFTAVPPVPMATFYPSTFQVDDQANTPLEPSSSAKTALRAESKDSLQPTHECFPSASSAQWHITLDTTSTISSLHTSLKTTERQHYDASRSRTLDPGASTPLHEVLIFTPSGLVIEGSMTSVYFFRRGRWVTPPVELGKGGQRGTTRRWALDAGLCVEEEVTVRSVIEGERVWVSNGVRGFGFGFLRVEAS
ncbi:hypothetical protein K402DRAFT_339783 [Aulographum hederae CBS 113979]|uniref:D-aminoacid aminotransferase-like PLP-dependent enzyme n=1 Tax=Aulographum hederae CBS 113979 TaxID=1176131 RepID=A0A6G1GP46_9PEZI|nr:hypothetical protein K402DRAFT_339783 [Aulographum hederae CBS 113979]